MSTRLSHNRTVPLWGFVVIIGVGSIIILGSVILGLRYYIRHHESKSESINDPDAIRRVTVRRGRIVPQSHYMSLTGSRFGVGAFDDARSGARSKSPFEWWNNVHSRSNSRLNLTPEPMVTGDTPRKQAPSPLRAAASFESMSEKPPAYTFPSKPSLAHRPSRNFSRLAVAPSIASSLPQIVEASPHQSMISRQSKQSLSPSVAVSELGAPRSPASMIGSRTTSYAEMPSTISEELERGRRQRSQTRIPRPTQNSSSRSKSLPRSPRPDPEPSTRPFVHTLNPPRTSSQPDRRPSLPRSPRRSSSTLNSGHSSYRAPGDADHVTGQLSNASVQALPQMSPTTDPYWETRQDLQPVRRKSQKGKVLRKKSLQRAERTSWVN